MRRIASTLLTAAALAAVSVAPLPLATPQAQARTQPLRPDCRAHVPRVGSAERRALMNALRPRVEAMVGKPVEFVVGKLNVACGYARLLASPQEKGGHGDHYEAVDAFFVKRNGVWRLGMIASSEPDSDPAADQYRARWPDAPQSLLYL